MGSTIRGVMFMGSCCFVIDRMRTRAQTLNQGQANIGGRQDAGQVVIFHDQDSLGSCLRHVLDHAIEAVLNIHDRGLKPAEIADRNIIGAPMKVLGVDEPNKRVMIANWKVVNAVRRHHQPCIGNGR